MAVQISGQIGPFLDNVQQRQVPVVVVGTCDYQPAGPVADPAQLDQHVQQQVLRAIRDVIAPKMASGQLQFRHLGTGDIAGILPEIIAATGLAQSGVQIGNLSLSFGIDGHAPQPPRPAATQGPQGPQIHAHVNVGGFKINASTSGGVDTAGLTNQLADKAKSTLIWWGIGAGVLLLVVIGLGVLGLYIKNSISSSMPGGSTASTATTWDGKSPLTCTGVSSMTVTGVTANLPGTAITASANCTLTLVNPDITAGTAIEAGGNATVIVQGGKISGSTAAVHAGGNAKVSFTGTKVAGKTQAGGNAKVTGN